MREQLIEIESTPDGDSDVVNVNKLEDIIRSVSILSYIYTCTNIYDTHTSLHIECIILYKHHIKYIYLIIRYLASSLLIQIKGLHH